MPKIIVNGMHMGYVAPSRSQDVSYDNTTSGLSATDVKNALDEINGKFSTISYNDLTDKPSTVSKSSEGFCPALPNEDTTTKYLRQDGTWVVPPNDNTTYSAGTGIGLSGTSFYLPIPRVAESCNSLPGAASLRFREYTGGSNYNLPSNAWYQILEIRSEDTKYGTQLALGMTTDAAYYRKYSGGSWGSWKSLIDTNTTYSAGSNITLSGTTFSLTKANVTGALGYTPPTTNTTYSAGSNITLSGTTFSLTKANVTGALGYTPPNGSINNATLTIQKNGSNVASFTANASSNVTANITVPTNTNQLTNGAGYITSSGSCNYATSAGSANSLKSGTWTFCNISSGVAALHSNNNGVNLETNSTNKWKLCMQADGNLVIYQNTTAKWNTGTSSRRFKHNIQDMTEERARKILDIRSVTFDWNDDQPVTTQATDNAGVIAEEVSQVIPDLVVFEDDFETGEHLERRVEYERFTPYLIKMIQLQEEKINQLESEMKQMRDELKSIK